MIVDWIKKLKELYLSGEDSASVGAKTRVFFDHFKNSIIKFRKVPFNISLDDFKFIIIQHWLCSVNSDKVLWDTKYPDGLFINLNSRTRSVICTELFDFTSCFVFHDVAHSKDELVNIFNQRLIIFTNYLVNLNIKKISLVLPDR